jgi:hypothetical protein
VFVKYGDVNELALEGAVANNGSLDYINERGTVHLNLICSPGVFSIASNRLKKEEFGEIFAFLTYKVQEARLRAIASTAKGFGV